MMTEAIVAEELSYDYGGGRALDRAGFHAPRGEITALVGPNGAGKTTLMRILAGLMRPQEGRARVFGVDVAEDPRAVHAMVGYLPDFIGLWDEMTVADHLGHAARAAGLDAADGRRRAEELAETLDLTEKLAAPAAQLSRGQRQRVAIAQALVKAPTLLILDEPASGLDPEARRGLSELMRALKRDGATLLVSSHILSELDDYSDRVLVIRDGRIARSAVLDERSDERIVEITLVEAPGDLVAALSAAAPGAAITPLDARRAEISVAGGAAAEAALLAALVRGGLPVAAFAPRRRRLEDAYFETKEAV